MVLRASLPPDYPSARPPVVELHAAHVADDVLGWAAQELEALFTPGKDSGNHRAGSGGTRRGMGVGHGLGDAGGVGDERLARGYRARGEQARE